MQVVEKVSEGKSQSLLPDDVWQTVSTLEPEAPGKLLAQCIAKYVLTADQFEQVLKVTRPYDWMKLLPATQHHARLREFVLHEANNAERAFAYHGNAFQVLWAMGCRDQAISLILEALATVQDVRTKSELLGGSMRLIRPITNVAEGMSDSVRKICEISLAVDIVAKDFRDDAWRDRVRLALLLGNREAAKTCWQFLITREAATDLSDFGEDDGRDERLEKLYRQAVEVLPEYAQELAEFAVDALVQRGRNFMAGLLAKRLGLLAEAKVAFARSKEKMLVGLSRPLNKFNYLRIGDCDFHSGAYSFAYEYYALAEEDDCMFRAAWEFDPPLAITIAQRMAALCIAKNCPDREAARIALQAGLPEAKQLYEITISALEKRADSKASVEEVIRFATHFGDTWRAGKYQRVLVVMETELKVDLSTALEAR